MKLTLREICLCHSLSVSVVFLHSQTCPQVAVKPSNLLGVTNNSHRMTSGKRWSPESSTDGEAPVAQDGMCWAATTLSEASKAHLAILCLTRSITSLLETHYVTLIALPIVHPIRIHNNIQPKIACMKAQTRVCHFALSPKPHGFRLMCCSLRGLRHGLT